MWWSGTDSPNHRLAYWPRLHADVLRSIAPDHSHWFHRETHLMSQLNRPVAPNPAFRPVAKPIAPASEISWSDPSQRTPLIALGGLTLLLVAAYWDMLTLVSSAWREDALYSHGYIIPKFALALMWMRFQPFRPVPTVERWMGLAILVGGLLTRL